jgi:phosphoribosylformylglycinamidine cyclo-ligase
MRYREAGVDVSRADAAKEAFGASVRSTWSDAVHSLPGGFAGVMRWPQSGAAEAGAPLLAATLDGIGTKLHLAIEAGRVADAAADLVYHGANDLLVHGARPLAFLDYVAQGRLDPDLVLAVISGLARACREVGAVLLGGETAEMPDTYLPRVADVAGCMIGTVDPDAVLDGGAVRAGDRVLGLASLGLHTNGFSLARRILAASGRGLEDLLPGGGGATIGEALLRPHRWYGPSLLPRLAEDRSRSGIKALAHVTGGGIAGNLARVIPPGLRARIDPSAWPEAPIFRWLIESGSVPREDARVAFNLGIGMLVVSAPAETTGLSRELAAAGERVWEIGEVVAGERGVEWVDAV